MNAATSNLSRFLLAHCRNICAPQPWPLACENIQFARQSCHLVHHLQQKELSGKQQIKLSPKSSVLAKSMHFSKTIFPPHHKGSQEYKAWLYNCRQFPFSLKILLVSPLFTKDQHDAASQNLCDSVRHHPWKTDTDLGRFFSCLLLLIKMSEFFVSLHCNLLVWHAIETISSCHQITKATISNARTGAFLYLERKLLLPAWEGETYNHSLYAHS